MDGARSWLTGITPAGLQELSGIQPLHVTWDAQFLDAVGYRDEDVERVLDGVHKLAPFDQGERELVKATLKGRHNTTLGSLAGRPCITLD